MSEVTTVNLSVEDDKDEIPRCEHCGNLVDPPLPCTNAECPGNPDYEEDVEHKIEAAFEAAGFPEYVTQGALNWGDHVRRWWQQERGEELTDEEIVAKLLAAYQAEREGYEKLDLDSAFDCISDAYCDLGDIVAGNNQRLDEYLSQDLCSFLANMHWQRYIVDKALTERKELLAALKLCREWLMEEKGSWRGTMDQIDAAIAKAEGR